MDKEASIKLHLAEVMGLEWLPEKGDQLMMIEVGGSWDVYFPFEDHAQWSKAVLWFISNGHTLMLQSDLVMANFDDNYAQPGDCTEVAHMAATLEVIAKATGWTGSRK